MFRTIDQIQKNTHTSTHNVYILPTKLYGYIIIIISRHNLLEDINHFFSKMFLKIISRFSQKSNIDQDILWQLGFIFIQGISIFILSLLSTYPLTTNSSYLIQYQNFHQIHYQTSKGNTKTNSRKKKVNVRSIILKNKRKYGKDLIRRNSLELESEPVSIRNQKS